MNGDNFYSMNHFPSSENYNDMNNDLKDFGQDEESTTANGEPMSFKRAIERVKNFNYKRPMVAFIIFSIVIIAIMFIVSFVKTRRIKKSVAVMTNKVNQVASHGSLEQKQNLASLLTGWEKAGLADMKGHDGNTSVFSSIPNIPSRVFASHVQWISSNILKNIESCQSDLEKYGRVLEKISNTRRNNSIVDPAITTFHGNKISNTVELAVEISKTRATLLSCEMSVPSLEVLPPKMLKLLTRFDAHEIKSKISRLLDTSTSQINRIAEKNVPSLTLSNKKEK